MTDVLTVGVITKPHGIRGEVRVYPYTEDIVSFLKDTEVILERRGKTLSAKTEKCRMQGGMALLKLSGTETRDEADMLRGYEINVKREDAPELPEGEYYVCDLLGLKAVTLEGEAFGTLTKVMHTGANDVYEITADDGRTVLVPAVHDYVTSIDMENRTLTFRLDKGML
ncbi:MAG: ribosome maturation factor RimM [Lachnospiraceae bacterium]|nr:ribosome maturation factor RimM [Lachnospiraceae bacterium]